jgi:DNA-binding transcriptional LysR family regulator
MEERWCGRDLNDYAYFAEVVAHGGFAAAGRVLREPKSKLSRRIAGLEARLGREAPRALEPPVRVTEVGQAFYERCRTLLLEAEQAEALVAEAKSEPHGRIRMSCPTGLVEVISDYAPQLSGPLPKVKLQLIAVDALWI